MSFLNWLEKKLWTSIHQKLDRIEIQGDLIMATLEEVTLKLEDINTAIAEERFEVQGLLADLRTQIQVLQDQLNQGQLVSQEQLDALAASADAIVARVRDISEPVV